VIAKILLHRSKKGFIRPTLKPTPAASPTATPGPKKKAGDTEIKKGAVAPFAIFAALMWFYNRVIKVTSEEGDPPRSSLYS